MAKVTITIEDELKDGESGVNITFDTTPEFKDGDEITLAHDVAMQFHNMIEEIKLTKKEKETE